jgi:hypothetical protein
MARSTVSRLCRHLAAKADGFHHAVEHLAVVDPDDVLAARDAEASMVSAIIMHISASAWTPGRADRVGVELHELAEPARPRLFVAEHPAGAVGAVGQLDVVDVFRT